MAEVRNEFQELLATLKEEGKTPDDVRWVGSRDGFSTWKEFVERVEEVFSACADATLHNNIVVVGDSWWLRWTAWDEDYQTAGWYLFEIPTLPKEHHIPHFDEDLQLLHY